MNTMFRIAAVSAAAIMAAGLALAPAAFAQSHPGGHRLSITEVDQRLSAQGFRVFEIEWDDGKYEVTATNAQGQCRELDIAPDTGAILRDRADDDCYDDRDDRRGRGASPR